MDVIKLDRTFLRDERDEKEEKMVENIVRMIHDLNRHVLCEGVETEEQAEFLLRVGCTMAQGFMFDRPLSKEDFETLNNIKKDDK
jgi:EAL domain-containing protein (putative c-di-GMP-specific phosphodiesterase class I)